MAKITRGTREELVRVTRDRYQRSTKPEKARILDEFVALTAYHRKHAIRVLAGAEADRPATLRAKRAPVYDEAVRQAMIVLWEASDRVCGKRLRPLLPILIPALERHGHLQLADAVRTRVFAVSAATIDRMLVDARSKWTGRRRGPGKPAIRSSIPVRTFADWKDPLPGYFEVDLVAHCGGSMKGSFAHTLVLTDIATSWTQCIPILVREASLIVAALEHLRLRMPLPMLGIDTDNGSEFINDTMLAYCTGHAIEFTRSRPHRKNDQAWVEQKNGAIVRRLVGYGRLEGVAASEALGRLYAASRLFVNFFQPSFKLADKHREGARVRKRYHPPETPCSRLLASNSIPETTKDKLRAVLVTLDPLRLLDEIRTVQHHVASLAAGESVHALPHRDADLDRFLRSLATAWTEGEARPTHRKGPRPPRHWRTRVDPFDSEWPRIVLWLEAEPDRTAKELFERLRVENHGAFVDGQLRTLQRRIKEWRRAAARRLIFAFDSLAIAPATSGA